MRIKKNVNNGITTANEILGVNGLMSVKQFLWCKLGEFGFGSTNNPLIDIFFFSHYLSAWYHVDTVRRNSILVTHGNLSVNRDCDTIPWLSNYSKKYFLHFSDDKCNTIHDTLKVSTLDLARRSIQSPSPVKSSYPSQTQNHYYYAIYNSCKFGMLYGTYYFLDQQRQ